MKKQRSYTGFGKELRRLMNDRDIHSWTELEGVILEETGKEYAHQSMSKYAAGKVNTIPNDFVVAFTAALKLDGKERGDLAEKYTYESRPEDSNDNGLEDIA